MCDSGDIRQCCSSSEGTAVLVTLCGVCDSGDRRQCCSNNEGTAVLVTRCGVCYSGDRSAAAEVKLQLC